MYYFIINPKAGQGENVEKISKKISEAVNSVKADAQIYVTKAVGDACAVVFIICTIPTGPATSLMPA